MKISLNWLKDYINTDLSAEKISEILSDLGFPTESIEDYDGDSIIDFEITSNRGDCLSHIGIARELAAATGAELKIPAVELLESEKPASQFTSVQIDEPNLCRRYTARIIEGVKVGPSPAWLKKRIEAIGMRSVNNVVDATNYAMMETGQPPHAFDYAKITDGKIIVRKAILGETIVSIDGSNCKLDPQMLVIADSVRPIALAGVMGGLKTEVTDQTTTILLEDAYFDPVCVRTTSRKLSLPSDASYRFERKVDVEMIDWASKRTAQLIIQVAGGKVAKSVVDVYPQKAATQQVTLRLPRLKKLLGIEIPQNTVIKILTALKLNPQLKADTIVCTSPSWRSDISREVDLIEEVARVYGFDKIPVEHEIKIRVVPQNKRLLLNKQILSYLNGCGFNETINVTFIDNNIADLFLAGDNKSHLAVKDVSRKNANLLRQTLIGSLLSVLKTNVNAKNIPCKIFEVADTFVPDPANVLPIEKTKLSLVCDGDFRLLKGVIEGLIADINKSAQTVFIPADLPWAQVGAQISVNGKVIGFAGLASKAVKDKFDFKEITPVAAELDFDSLLELKGAVVKVKPLPKFPAIDRDITLLLEEAVTWADIVNVVNKKAPAELEDVKFVGIYRGKGIEQGSKSLTLSLRFRDEDGTLTHQQVDSFESGIVNALKEQLKAEMRTA